MTALRLAGILVIVCVGHLVAAPPIATTNNGLAIWYDARGDLESIMAPEAPWNVGTQVMYCLTKKHNCDFLFEAGITAGNMGGPGDAQHVFVSPRLPLNPETGLALHVTGVINKKGQFIGAIDHSVKPLFCYMTVEARSQVDEVITSLGRDTDVVSYGVVPGSSYPIDVTVAMNPTWWDSVSSTLTPLGNGFVVETEAEKDAFASGSFDATGGAVPGGVYQVAEWTIRGGDQGQDNEPLASFYSIRDRVNAQTITRAYDGSGPEPELPDFGYELVDVVGLGETFISGGNGGLPEGGSGDGATVGSSSLTDDATISVLIKGDFNRDGYINGSDIVGFNRALGAEPYTLAAKEVFAGDFTNDGFVNGSDIRWFNVYLSEL